MVRQHNFITGVNLGVTTRLPRCPAMFERKKKEKTYAEVWDGHSATKENYRSVMGRVEEVRVQFLNEASFYGQDGGMMTETSLAQLAQLSECAPEDIALAALGALEKGDPSFRVLFDATRGVKANPRTRPRDQLRCPGIREGRTEMAYYKAKQAKTFCLAGDVAKAHRRFRTSALGLKIGAFRLASFLAPMVLAWRFGSTRSGLSAMQQLRIGLHA